MAFLSDIKDIKVTFGLDPNIQVEQGIKIFLDPRVYSSLALGHEDDKREERLTLGHEDDREERNGLRSGLMMRTDGSSPSMTVKGRSGYSGQTRRQ